MDRALAAALALLAEPLAAQQFEFEQTRSPSFVPPQAGVTRAHVTAADFDGAHRTDVLYLTDAGF